MDSNAVVVTTLSTTEGLRLEYNDDVLENACKHVLFDKCETTKARCVSVLGQRPAQYDSLAFKGKGKNCSKGKGKKSSSPRDRRSDLGKGHRSFKGKGKGKSCFKGKGGFDDECYFKGKNHFKGKGEFNHPHNCKGKGNHTCCLS